MKLFAASAFALGLSLFAFAPSQAMPLAPLAQTAANDGIIQVYGGCGWGGHRGPYGGCRALYNCPPGMPVPTAGVVSATGKHLHGRGPRIAALPNSLSKKA